MYFENNCPKYAYDNVDTIFASCSYFKPLTTGRCLKSYYLGVLRSRNFALTSKVRSAAFVPGNFILIFNKKRTTFILKKHCQVKCQNLKLL